MTTEQAIEALRKVKLEVLVDEDIDFYLALELAERSLERNVDKRKRRVKDAYFCTVCGTRIKHYDNFCYKCGQKFLERDDGYE